MSNDVVKTQKMLNQLGYNAGPVDGAYGGKTKRALEAFYAESGGSYDGKLDTQANVAAAKLEAYWSQMRLAESEVLGMSLVKVIPASNALA